MSPAVAVEVLAEDAAAVVVAEIVATEANVVKAESVASVLIARMARPAVEDPVVDMEESAVDLEEDVAVTVEVAEAAARSSASTRMPSPPWDKKPQRR